MISLRTLGIIPAVCSAALALLACRSRPEGVDIASLPPDIRPDYELFAQRCSKCHSLSRPLGSGIETDSQWEHYFERMRLLPGSGLTPDDKKPILRFLHYYSAERRRQEAAAEQAAAPEAGPRDGGAE